MDIDESIDLWYKLATALNKKINQDGQIQKNWTWFWNEYLHPMTDQQWVGLCEAINTLQKQHPEMLTVNDHHAVMNAISVLDDEEIYQYVQNWNMLKPETNQINNVLDIRFNQARRINSTQHHAWKLTHVLREVWCRCCDIDLPNENSSIGKLDNISKSDNYFKLFAV